MEVINAIQFLLSSGWHFLTGIEVPGMGFTFAQFMVGLFLARLGLRFLSLVLGVGFGSRDLDEAEAHGIIKRRSKKP